MKPTFTSVFFILSLNFFTQFTLAQNSTIDSLKILLPQTVKDTNDIKLVNQLVVEFVKLNNLDSTIKYSNIAVAKSKKIDYVYGQFIALHSLANIYSDNNKIQKSINIRHEIIQIKGLDTVTIAKVLNYNGILKAQSGRIAEAIEDIEKALNIIGDKDNNTKAYIYNAIARIQRQQGNNKLAIENDSMAIEIYKTLNYKPGIAVNYLNLGNSYQNLKKYNKSIEYFRKCYDAALSIDMKSLASCAIGNLGHVYADLYEDQLSLNSGNTNENKIAFFDSAYNNMSISLKLAKEANSIKYIQSSKLAIADLMLHKKEYKVAIPFYLEIYNNFKGNDITHQKDVAKSLYTSYKETGKYKEALNWHETLLNLQDSIYSSDKNQKLNEIMEKYENDKKQQQLELQEIEINHKESELNTQKSLAAKDRLMAFIFLGIIIGAVLFICYLIFIFNKLKRLSAAFKKLSIVASKIKSPIAITSPSGIIEYINPSFENIYKTNSQAILGKQLDNVNNQKELKNIITKVVTSKSTFEYINKVDSQWIQTTVNPVLNDNLEDVDKLVFVDTDISDLKAVEANLQAKNQLIHESIESAKSIQQALLPPEKAYKEFANDAFVFFKPKDIVSGDFYYFKKKENNFYFAGADCTGHGVSGALMSFLSITSLDNVIKSDKTTSTADILDRLSNQIKYQLNSNASDVEEKRKEGLDLAFCKYNIETKLLTFSSAYNSIYFVRNGILSEFKGDKIHLGYIKREDQKFTEQQIEIQNGDQVYLFSDGFPDQKGGEKRKKFFYKAFRNLLEQNSHRPLNVQKELLDYTLKNWMKTHPEQMDDILVMGIKF